MAALLSALVVSGAIVAAPAAAEGSDSAEIVNQSERGVDWFPVIRDPAAPEEYPVRWDNLGPELTMRQVDDQEVVVEYIEGGYTAWTIEAVPAADAVGATVPTTVKLTEGNVVTLTVHYRAGNLAAGGAPFVFPITEGKGWEGGWFFGISEHGGELQSPPEAPPPSPPTPTCAVPRLHGLSFPAAKARLRAADCSLGRIRLGRGATKAKGRVVKQFHPAGTQLEAGAPVAVRLGTR